MRTETTTRIIYKLEELPQDVQERALEQFNLHEEYHWGDDALASLKKLAEHFGGSLSDWRIDWSCAAHSHLHFNMPDDMGHDEIAERLEQLGTFNPETFKGHGDCKLTGFCHDESAIDGFRKAFLKDGETDLDDLMRAAGETWLYACQADYEYQTSMEAFRETCDANEYEFDEHGNMV